MLKKLVRMICLYVTSVHDRHKVDIDPLNFTVEVNITGRQANGELMTVVNAITVKDGEPYVYSETIRNSVGQILNFIPGAAGNAKKKTELSKAEERDLLDVWKNLKKPSEFQSKPDFPMRTYLEELKHIITAVSPMSEDDLSIVNGHFVALEPTEPFTLIVDGEAMSNEDLTSVVDIDPDNTTGLSIAAIVAAPPTKKIRAKKAAKEVGSE